MITYSMLLQCANITFISCFGEFKIRRQYLFMAMMYEIVAILQYQFCIHNTQDLFGKQTIIKQNTLNLTITISFI